MEEGEAFQGQQWWGERGKTCLAGWGRRRGIYTPSGNLPVCSRWAEKTGTGYSGSGLNRNFRLGKRPKTAKDFRPESLEYPGSFQNFRFRFEPEFPVNRKFWFSSEPEFPIV